jgi:hypothetical protein
MEIYGKRREYWYSLLLKPKSDLLNLSTKFTIFGADELASVKLESGRRLGTQLETHRHNRVEQLCFRRSPAAYLADLEAQIIQ